jgi:hypothetical protein
MDHKPKELSKEEHSCQQKLSCNQIADIASLFKIIHLQFTTD